MYTLQWSHIENALREGGELGEGAIKALAQLGNCQAQLEHRGPVEIIGSFPNAPNFPLDGGGIGLGYDEIAAPLKIDNRFSFRDGDDNHVHNGFAAAFRGVVKIHGGDFVVQPHFPGGGVLGGNGPPGGNNNPGGNIILMNPQNNPDSGQIITYNGTTHTVASPLWYGKTTGAISAASGTTPGSGNAEIYALSSGVGGNAQAITVLSPFANPIPSGTYGMIGQVTNGTGTSRAYMMLSVAGTFEPCYAARTTGTSSNIVLESSGLYGDRWKLKLDSTIHRRPDDATVFSLDATNYEVTIAQTGFCAFGGWVKVQHDNDDSQRRIWLEEADAGAYDVDATWTEVYGTTDYMNLGLHAGRENAVCTFYVEHLLSASKKYRIGVAGGYSVDPTTVTACEGRLNVHKFRDL